MKQSINVPFTINNKEVEVSLFYSIALEGATHTINCKVDVDNFDAHLWHWLEIRSFQLQSMILKDGYAQLYAENDNIKSSDTILFIECAYNHIMKQEKLPLAKMD